jgi:hypothetical protein
MKSSVTRGPAVHMIEREQMFRLILMRALSRFRKFFILDKE